MSKGRQNRMLSEDGNERIQRRYKSGEDREARRSTTVEIALERTANWGGTTVDGKARDVDVG